MSRKSTQEVTQSVTPDLGSKDRKSPRDLILGRRTDELVLAFCGPLGSGVSTIARKVEQILETYNYKTKYIRISEYIEKLLNEGTIPELALPADRIEKLQDEGDNLREKYGNDVLAQFAISEIAHDRRLKGTKEKNSPSPPPVESRRVATIIDGLKHPEEVKLLKLVYQSMFFLFGVLCPEEIRKKHLLENKEIKPEDATRLMERDKSEEFKHGQHLVETLQHSDFFIRNSSYNINKIEPPIKRFIDLILGENVITPTSEEHTMYLAHSAALRSGCLSRQVGAAIISSDGVILSTGCNDVPKFGGGLYTIDDGENDNRCMNKYGRECQNEKYRERIFRDIEKSISVEFKNITDAIKLEDGGLEEHISIIKKNLETGRGALIQKIEKHERIGSLIEFCRSVHAEMNAILQAALNNGSSLQGATLFCTTFPCHSCARHIVAAGIRKVYYIEPYEKSMAIELHRDSIELEPNEPEQTAKKVIFQNFEGVAPIQYINLFQERKRKSNGELIVQKMKENPPVTAQFLDTYREYESKVVSNLHEIGLSEKVVNFFDEGSV